MKHFLTYIFDIGLNKRCVQCAINMPRSPTSCPPPCQMSNTPITENHEISCNLQNGTLQAQSGSQNNYI